MKNDISKYFIINKNNKKEYESENEFEFDDISKKEDKTDNFIEIYTDGACILNGKKHAKSSFAYVIYSDDKILAKESKVINGEIAFSDENEKHIHTNQKAELLAIYYALLYIKNNMQINTSKNLIRLYSDSEYSIKCLTEWCMNWTSKDWEIKKNTHILKKILQLLPSFNISFQHIKAHQTIDEINVLEKCNNKQIKHVSRNNYVDKLAREQLISK
jgi:ribonuclease HI